LVFLRSARTSAPRFNARLGQSRSELIELATSIDPTTITHPGERQRLETIEHLAGAAGLASALEELGAVE
jgi:hypothetical protein